MFRKNTTQHLNVVWYFYEGKVDKKCPPDFLKKHEDVFVTLLTQSFTLMIKEDLRL